MSPLSLRGSATPGQIVGLGRQMAEDSRFARLGYDDALADGYARWLLTDDSAIGFGLFAPAGLVGMVTGLCGPTLPFSRAIVANEHLLYVSPAHRGARDAIRLVQAFIGEATARGARDITFSNGTGYEPERVGKLFETCGLSRVGGLYIMEI